MSSSGLPQSRSRHPLSAGAAGSDASLARALRQLAQQETTYGTIAACACLVILLGAAAAFAILSDSSRYQVTGLVVSGLVVSALIICRQVSWRGKTGRRLAALATTAAALHEERQKAEASSSAKSRFLAITSHEIRTPMNGVIGMIGLLLETPLSAEQRNYARKADASARALLSIVDELLDASLAERDSVDVRKEPFDLAGLIESVTELLAPRAHAKGIEISCFVSSLVPAMVAGDEKRLRQVLLNLCGNAIKFTASGGVAISARLAGSGQLSITVSDTGIGMTDEEQQRIFDEFMQGNEETRRLFGGTGLGLTISRKLIEAMGGSIAVSSSPGLGSVFQLILPLDDAPSLQQPSLLAGRDYVIVSRPCLTAAHIKDTLEDYGARVKMMREPGELVRLLTDEDGISLDAIICDSDFAETLRNTESPFPRRIFILMRTEERRQYASLLYEPLRGYLLKPFRRQSLLRLMTAHDEDVIASAVQDLRDIVKSEGQLAPLQVLLAEDNPVNALLAQTVLRREGHRVAHVTDGEKVLEALSHGPLPDLIIMDVEMPVLDGLETTRRIRRMERESGASRMPILALTANAHKEDIAECLEAGMDGHLSKPFDRQDLEETIARLVMRQAA